MSFAKRWIQLAVFIVSALALTSCGQNDGKDGSGPRFNAETGQDAWQYPRDRSVLPEDLRMVTDDYGPLVLELGEFKYEADVVPYSSFWHPFASTELFQRDNGLSVLEKYDRVLSVYMDKDVRAAEYHAENRYNPNMVRWAGLCDARALASVYEVEPQSPKSIMGICFSIADLKALQTFKYEKTNPDDWNGWYGQRNDNRPHNIYSDIYPEQFHRFMVQELGERRMPFLMDHDASLPVWTEAVYMAFGEVKRHPEDRNKVVVQTYMRMPKYALNDRERSKSINEPLGANPLTRVYTYELSGRWRGSRFHVTEGKWSGTSIMDHPDFVISLPDPREVNVEMGSFNPELTVDRINWLLEQAESAPACTAL